MNKILNRMIEWNTLNNDAVYRINPNNSHIYALKKWGTGLNVQKVSAANLWRFLF